MTTTTRRQARVGFITIVGYGSRGETRSATRHVYSFSLLQAYSSSPPSLSVGIHQGTLKLAYIASDGRAAPFDTNERTMERRRRRRRNDSDPRLAVPTSTTTATLQGRKGPYRHLFPLK